MADYVWLEEIERLEAERNDGKTLDGYDIQESKKLTLLETLTREKELCNPAGQYGPIGPSAYRQAAKRRQDHHPLLQSRPIHGR